MKKREILKLIEANRIIIENSALLSIARDKNHENTYVDKENWFPNVEELKDEFDILANEVQSALDEVKNCEIYIQNSDCNHEVRLKHYGLFCHHSKCIFCGQSTISDNCVNWEYSINRNKYCVDLVAKHQEDEDCGCISHGYTVEQVYEIIEFISKDKSDDEDIDLVQEFKSLNLENCNINEDKKVNENYVLIIGGVNKQFVDNDTFFSKNGAKLELDFFKYFSGLLNAKVELISNSEVFENVDFNNSFVKKNYNLKFVGYDTLDELEMLLLSQREIPFKMIIDLSELYKYKISDGNVSKDSVFLKLKEFFPTSYVIRIDNLSKKSLEELSKYLKSVQSFDSLYVQQNGKYYYLEDNEVKAYNLENTCGRIKKLLRQYN